MPYMFLPDQGLKYFLDLAYGINTYAFPPEIGLYVSSHTPAAGDTISTYNAIECTVPGYARITLSSGAWSVGVSGSIATYTYPTLTWNFTTNTSVQSIYGLFIHGAYSGGNIVVGAIQLPGPVLIPPTASSYSFNLTSSDLSR